MSGKRNSKQNFMQQQNRPIQKGKGKRIFLEMRDSQLAPSSSDPSLGNKMAVSSASNIKDRSPNPQLKQKEIGNSRDDSML